jgi:hypothetical protein
MSDINALFQKYYIAETEEDRELAVMKLSGAYLRMNEQQKYEFDQIVTNDDLVVNRFDSEGDEFFFDYDGDALASAGFGTDEDY